MEKEFDMKRIKVFLANLLVLAMVLTMIPIFSYAETTSSSGFVDMPNDWSTDALEKAVSNGLISGFDEYGLKYIKPGSALTRAQMATIVNRAFGAVNTTSISGARDVSSSDWFYREMAKAVKMGTFKLDTYMRPDAPITRQEAFTVLARAFKLTSTNNIALNNFLDGSSVASYAKSAMSAMINSKYVTGSGGYLYPEANMSRAEFAKVMDNLVKRYCDEASEVVTVSSLTGNLLINKANVTLRNSVIRGDLIIGDGVGSGDVTLDNVDVTGNIVVRGGGTNTVLIKGNCDVNNMTVAKVDGNVRVTVESGARIDVANIDDGTDDVILEGDFRTIHVNAEIEMAINDAEIDSMIVYETSTITLDADTEVDRLTVEDDAAGTRIVNNGLITSLRSDEKIYVTGTGTVTENLALTGTTPITAIAAIVGTAKVGSELKAGALTPSTATVNYQWKIANSANGTYSNITGATSSTYTPVGADYNKYIKLTVTGKGNYSGTLTSAATGAIAVSKITAVTIPGITAPVLGATPVRSLASTNEYTATITWTPNPTTFEAGVAYTATITLTPKAGYTVTGITSNQFKVAGATATNSANSGVISAAFPAIATVTKISATNISGVTAPVIGATPVTAISGAEYTGTVTWSPADAKFKETTTYTATVTLTPKTGYTLTGVTANQFVVNGAVSSSNTANSGVITAVFPQTPAPSVITDTTISGLLPAVDETPIRIINRTQYTATIAWSPNDATFAPSTSYAAVITITPNPGYTLTGILENQFEVTGATSDANGADSGIINVSFPATEARTTISTAISGVAPTVGGTPEDSLNTPEYTATVSWTPNPMSFEAGGVYTAVITITPRAKYTVTGIAANSFTVDGFPGTNAADSGTVTVTFPALAGI